MTELNSRVDPVIGYKELLSNCFSSSTLERTKGGVLGRGLYVFQLSWDVEGLPFGDQIIWLFYDTKSDKRLEKLHKDVEAWFEKISRHCMVVIEDYDLKRPSLVLEMQILSDGHLTNNDMTMKLDNGVTGHMAVYCGQGRRLDFDDPNILDALHTIISNLIPDRALRNDPFIRDGREKVKRLIDFMVKQGADVRYGLQRSGRKSSFGRRGQ